VVAKHLAVVRCQDDNPRAPRPLAAFGKRLDQWSDAGIDVVDGAVVSRLGGAERFSRKVNPMPLRIAPDSKRRVSPSVTHLENQGARL
jgi:hypothetical protein